MNNNLNFTLTNSWLNYTLPSNLSKFAYQNKVREIVDLSIGKYCDNKEYLSYLTFMVIDEMAKKNYRPLSPVMIYLSISEVLRESYSAFFKGSISKEDITGVIQKERNEWINHNFPTNESKDMLRLAIQSTMKVKFGKDLHSKASSNALIASTINLIAELRLDKINEKTISKAINIAVERLFKEDSGLTKFLINRSRI
ncbi:hypothetical protein ACS126_09850 [Sphingobacterium lactis]|uniref:hypothetical protein n=1 Tax=Sphingobacterium lactis TaxID=797291 RepID=UPI003EC79A64